MIELLSPVGNFECLKAAVQNGADCVYFGANTFSARAFASNFNLEDLKKAITYAKLRGVKTNLTLNTLIKDNEFSDAINLATKAYEYGIDAIIVQDLGLGLSLIKMFPDLPIHASTQMSIHNLQGVLKLQELGFKRVVLARELSAEEINYICKNSSIEIECFIHGALCISYSGQCLFSSMVGGRSGNRGKCAQPCRLPYTLIDNNEKELDKGYLLSPRDLCGLEYLPFLIKSGVVSFKIEGRMKSPEYVATVTKIYRKYIDLATSSNEFEIEPKDKKALLQVFNRGLSSLGHLSKDSNKELIYKQKPNNMGLPLGIVQKYNKNKGYITLKLKEPLQIGDTISLENEDGTYTISELMENKKNIQNGNVNQIVTIGRMKGNISIKDKIFKISSKELTSQALKSVNSNNKKVLLNASVRLKKDCPISITVTSSSNISLYKDLNLEISLNEYPVEAINKPLSKEIIIEKLSKTGNTFYDFCNISIELDNNVFLPKISSLNELRRKALEEVELFAINKITRKYNSKKTNNLIINNKNSFSSSMPKISLLLNNLNSDFDYSKLINVDYLYIPLKYFANKKYESILYILSERFNMYIYLPTIIKANYRNIFHNNIASSINKYKIKGFVLSNISNFVLVDDLVKSNSDLDLIANYTFNIFNNITINELYKLGISKYILSPELDENTILHLYNSNCKKELIVYGKIPLMNSNYCLLGKTNKCYPQCDAKCSNLNNKFYLKDRKQMKFDIVPDNIQTVTTIYNSKILSILPTSFNIDSARIDILYEDIEEINKIIETVKSNKKFEGNMYTNGNLNRQI